MNEQAVLSSSTIKKKPFSDQAIAFQRIREQILTILQESLNHEPRHMAYIYTIFMYKYGYLPDLERRMRELVDSGLVIKHGGAIPKYSIKENTEVTEK